MKFILIKLFFKNALKAIVSPWFKIGLIIFQLMMFGQGFGSLFFIAENVQVSPRLYGTDDDLKE